MSNWAPKDKIETVLSSTIYEEAQLFTFGRSSPARIELPAATLWRWFDLAERYNLVLAEMESHIYELERKQT